MNVKRLILVTGELKQQPLIASLQQTTVYIFKNYKVEAPYLEFSHVLHFLFSPAEVPW